MTGSKNSYIATLVERHTRYVMLAKVGNKDTQTVISALIKQAKKLPSELYKSFDLGPGQGAYGSSDNSRWQPTSTSTSAIHKVPGSAGRNENANGLLRQYFPKGPTYRCTREPYLRVAVSSTNGHARPCNLKLQQEI